MRRADGVTLVEMLAVMAVLALVVAVGVPRADAVAEPRLDAAAVEIRQACRFAQDAALRTGAPYAVDFDVAAQVMRVVQLDATWAEDTSVTVMRPVDQAPYRIVFGGGALSATIVSAVFRYQSSATTSVVSFGTDGAPLGQVKNKLDQLKGDGVVTLQLGRAVRIVTIDAGTGRVTF